MNFALAAKSARKNNIYLYDKFYFRAKLLYDGQNE
jgi:hypothetical protein